MGISRQGLRVPDRTPLKVALIGGTAPLRQTLSVVARYASPHPHHHVFDPRVVVQPYQSPFAPEAALLIAPEWGTGAAGEVLVDHDVSGLDVVRKAKCAVDVAGEDSRRQTVVGVVCRPQGFLLVAEGQDG